MANSINSPSKPPGILAMRKETVWEERTNKLTAQPTSKATQDFTYSNEPNNPILFQKSCQRDTTEPGSQKRRCFAR